jgi:anthranilate phosphoribosyltransferase
LNAAAGITAYELSKVTNISEFELVGSLHKNYDKAQQVITDGTALAKLNQWVQLSQSAGE